MPSHNGHHQRSDKRGFVMQAARVVIAAVCLGALCVVAFHGLNVTVTESTGYSVRSWEFADAQQECLYHEIRSQLPRSSSVFILGNDTFNVQRLIELSTPWVVLQVSPATANWIMSIVTGSTCSGMSLKVQRLIHPRPVTSPKRVTSILHPANGAMLSGIVALDAYMEHTSKSTLVDFLLTGGAQHATPIGIGRLSLYGWVTQWDTTTVTNGTYTLQSVAHNPDGRIIESPPIIVTVDN